MKALNNQTVDCASQFCFHDSRRCLLFHILVVSSKISFAFAVNLRRNETDLSEKDSKLLKGPQVCPHHEMFVFLPRFFLHTKSTFSCLIILQHHLSVVPFHLLFIGSLFLTRQRRWVFLWKQTLSIRWGLMILSLLTVDIREILTVPCCTTRQTT